MKRSILLFLVAFTSTTICAQPPGYYTSALGKNGSQLQNALHGIIDNHSVQSWPLWSVFTSTDNKGGNILWDIYSDIPGATPSYTYTIGTDQCGQYNSEGDCYNHEHIWPKTYFNDATPMSNDLHHIMPTDGWVNNKRGNFPIGEISTTSWTSTNGSKTGTSLSYTGYTGNVFEPIDEYKGDVARMYFYMSTRYKGEDNSWTNWEMANGAVLKADAVQLLLQWHHNDTVSQKEIDRNNVIYAKQGNRNPFIDYPIFADCIWGTTDCTPLMIEDVLLEAIQLAPNPSNSYLRVQIPSLLRYKALYIEVFNPMGEKQLSLNKKTSDISSLSKGFYSIRIFLDEKCITLPFLKK